MTESEVDPVVVTTPLELLQSSELSGITVFELRVRRVEKPEEIDVPDEPRPVQVTWQVLEQHHTMQMQCRFRVTVVDLQAEYFADMATVYGFNKPIEVEQPVIAEFIEKVAVMAIYPFMREAIFTSASRLGIGPPVLGLLRQGEFKLNPPERIGMPESEEKVVDED